MIIDWPDYFPCFQRSGYAYSHSETHQTTTFGAGFTRTRRLPNGPVTFEVSLKLTSDQLEAFENWREYDLKDIGWFNAKLKTGSGLEDWVVRFMSKSGSVQLLSPDKWQLSFQVQARKPSLLSIEAYYEKAYGFPADGGTNLLDIVKRYDTDYYL